MAGYIRSVFKYVCTYIFHQLSVRRELEHCSRCYGIFQKAETREFSQTNDNCLALISTFHLRLVALSDLLRNPA